MTKREELKYDILEYLVSQGVEDADEYVTDIMDDIDGIVESYEEEE